MEEAHLDDIADEDGAEGGDDDAEDANPRTVRKRVTTVSHRVRCAYRVKRAHNA
jgi:hypothetical protein